MNPRVYVVRKVCGCIVAAFPVQGLEPAIKGKLLEQFAKAGFDVDQADQYEVNARFALDCDCNKPPLLREIERVQVKHFGVDMGVSDFTVTQKVDPATGEILEEVTQNEASDPEPAGWVKEAVDDIQAGQEQEQQATAEDFTTDMEDDSAAGQELKELADSGGAFNDEHADEDEADEPGHPEYQRRLDL